MYSNFLKTSTEPTTFTNEKVTETNYDLHAVTQSLKIWPNCTIMMVARMCVLLSFHAARLQNVSTDGEPPKHDDGAYGLRGSCRLRLTNPKGRSILTVPQFGLQNPGLWGAKISRDPVHGMCSQGILAVPLLASILRSWHQGSWK